MASPAPAGLDHPVFPSARFPSPMSWTRISRTWQTSFEPSAGNCGIRIASEHRLGGLDLCTSSAKNGLSFVTKRRARQISATNNTDRDLIRSKQRLEPSLNCRGNQRPPGSGRVCRQEAGQLAKTNRRAASYLLRRHDYTHVDVVDYAVGGGCHHDAINPGGSHLRIGRRVGSSSATDREQRHREKREGAQRSPLAPAVRQHQHHA